MDKMTQILDIPSVNNDITFWMMSRASLFGQYEEHPHVGNNKFKRSGAASAAPLLFFGLDMQRAKKQNGCRFGEVANS